MTKKAKKIEKTEDPERNWDVVDQASFDSFPASDPPGYYSSHASTNPMPEKPREDDKTATTADEKKA